MPKKRAPKQLEFRFMEELRKKPSFKQLEFEFMEGLSKKEKVRRLMGRTKQYSALYELGDKLIGQTSHGNNVRLYWLKDGPKTEQPLELGFGLLSAHLDYEISRNFPRVPEEQIGMIGYQLHIGGPRVKQAGLEIERKGLGSAIINALEEKARSHGLKLIYAITPKTNTASRKTLEKLGFKELGTPNPYSTIYVKMLS